MVRLTVLTYCALQLYWLLNSFYKAKVIIKKVQDGIVLFRNGLFLYN
ncbi:hypothetical protein [Pedobacter endophyticus]|nr:hypothetical protein [Pedobacter endophyticus]